MKLVTRSQWGARAPQAPAAHLASTRGVKVHYTGDTVDVRLADDHDRCAPLVREIQDFHIDGRKWNDIAYSFAICPHGYVFEGRGLHHLPAANGEGLNSGHYALLGMVGNKGLIEPSDAMLNGIRDAIDYVRTKGDAGTEIKGHRDGYSTDCPGPKLYAWVKDGAPRKGGSAAPAWPGRVLAKGMWGEDVRTWQTQMRKRGWIIPVDGVYAQSSVNVCEAFQAEKHLKKDGLVGKITWRASWEAPVT